MPQPHQQVSRVQVHELVAENASLKARLNATLEELRTTKDICMRNYKPRRAATSRGDGSSANSTIMSFALYADASSQTRTREAHADASVQTVVGDSFDSTEEVRRLKAEVLRSHAEVASLQQALNVVRRSAGSASPTRGALSGETHSQRSPSASGSPRHHLTATAAEEADLAHEQTMNRINMLTEALKAAHNTIAEREQEIASLKVAASATTVGGIGSGSLRGAGQAGAGGALFLNKGTGTDDPILDLDIPLSPRDRDAVGSGQKSEHAAALQSALDVTRLQLRQALEELAETRAASASSIAMSPVRERRVQHDVAVNVDTLYPFERLFRLYKRPFTPEGVEAALREADSATQRAAVLQSELALQGQLSAAGGGAVTTSGSAAPINGHGELQRELDTTRRDLMEAHERIDELEYAIELERKERARHSAFMGTDANKQAAAEIAFLCDTLAATRTEMERLSARLETAEIERDAAVASFHDLRTRSEDMLRGCQAITESARVDADSSIQQMVHATRQQNHEVNLLRGQLAALNRQLDEAKKRRDAAEKEATATKLKLTQMRDSVARLREDYNTQAVALREARAAAASAGGNVFALNAASAASASAALSQLPPSASPIREGSHGASAGGRSASADPTSLQALEAALGQGEDPADTSASARAAGSRATAGGAITLRAPSANSSNTVARTPHRAASPAPRRAKSGADDGGIDYRGEYEELHGCFLLLAPMVPGAVTAREVTQGICAGLEKLNERIKAFEVEVRKRTTQVQTLKKDLAAAQELISSLDKKTAHMAVVEKKLEHKEKQAERARRMLTATKSEAEKSLQEVSFEKETLAVELERTKEALALARRELAEGRELMMSLIQES